jgi:hypothetical protein
MKKVSSTNRPAGKWQMTPERFATVFRVVVRHEYKGITRNLKFALQHKDEFVKSPTPEGFIEANHIELIGDEQ